MVVFLFVLTGCGSTEKARIQGPRLDHTNFNQALHFLQEGLREASEERWDEAEMHVSKSEDLLEKFFAQDPFLENRYGKKGLEFLVPFLTSEERDLYREFLPQLEKRRVRTPAIAVPEEAYGERLGALTPGMDNEEEKETFSELKECLESRIRAFKNAFSGRIGMTVRSMEDNHPVFDENSDECMIPASMIKIVLSSALICALQGPSGDLDPEVFFQHEKERLGWSSGCFDGSLGSLFNAMNHYSLAGAPRANQIAEQAAGFLENILGAEGQNRASLLLRHLDRISWVYGCNRIDDASGLSLQNRLTPSQAADCMFFLKDCEPFLYSLPSPGEGTLSNRLLDMGRENRFKTGSLQRNGVISFAGYLKEKGRNLIFVIMINLSRGEGYEGAIDWTDDTVRAMQGISG